MIRWAMQETLWKSFLKKRVKPRRLAKQESWRQKSICWNCYKQNLRNKSLKNQKSSIDFQDFSAIKASKTDSPYYSVKLDLSARNVVAPLRTSGSTRRLKLD